MLYTAGSDNCVTMYDTKTWEKTGVLKGHKAWVNAMVIDEKRNLLYTASDDTTVIVWDVKTQERIQTLKGHNEGAISLQLLGSKLVVGCTGRIMVWDTKSWKLVDELTQHTQVLRAMSDGKQMSKMLGIDPRIVIAREAAKLVGQKIGGIASSKHYMFSAVDEGSIWVWEKRHLEVERKLLGPQGVNMDPVWVRSLEVIELPHPTTGRLCLKL